MHALTPNANEASRHSSVLSRAAHLHGQWRDRRWLGLRATAVLETMMIIALLLLIDRLLGRANQFMTVTPHPFWIPVLLMAAYYGLRESLFAAAVGTAVLLVAMSLAPHAATTDARLMLRMTIEPMLWFVAALVLGEIRDTFRRRMQGLSERALMAEEQAAALRRACDQLTRQKTALQSRVADQTVTVNAMYEASRAIERDGVGEVLLGVAKLVRTALNPTKFSMYLVNGAKLEAAISDGWQAGDAFARVFDANTPLFRAIALQRRSLNVVNPIDEPLLRDEGLLAAPIINQDRNEVVGMVKIESMDFMDLHGGTVQNFQVLCDWIGAAISHAQRLERMQQGAAGAAGATSGRLASPLLLATLVRHLQALSTTANVDVSVLWIEMTLEQNAGPLLQLAATTMESATAKDHIACHIGKPGGFAVLMPGVSLEQARTTATAVVDQLRDAVEELGAHAMVRHRLLPLSDLQVRA